MFKYPLAVTIDTNIFDAAKFDLCDTSTLEGSTEHLINTIGQGEVLRIITNKDELISNIMGLLHQAPAP